MSSMITRSLFGVKGLPSDSPVSLGSDRAWDGSVLERHCACVSILLAYAELAFPWQCRSDLDRLHREPARLHGTSAPQVGEMANRLKDYSLL